MDTVTKKEHETIEITRISVEIFMLWFLASVSSIRSGIQIHYIQCIEMVKFVAIPLTFSSFFRKAINVIIIVLDKRTNLNVKLFGCVKIRSNEMFGV